MRLIDFLRLTALALNVSVTAIATLSSTAYAYTPENDSFSRSMISSNQSGLASPEEVPQIISPRPMQPNSKIEEAGTRINNTTSRDSANETSEPRGLHFNELGICRGYIPSQAEPDSFEYREGMYRCQYGL